MEKFTIVSTTTNVQGKKVIGGQNVVFTYNFEENKKPLAVVFNLQRENGTISGTYYTDSKRFDVNNSKYAAGDAQIIDEIFNTCEEIASDYEKQD